MDTKNNYMPSTVTQTTGARVAIHPSDVTPLMGEAGLEVGLKSINSISISEVGERATDRRPGVVAAGQASPRPDRDLPAVRTFRTTR